MTSPATSARSSSTTTSRVPGRFELARRALDILRTLRDAGVVEIVRPSAPGRLADLRLTVDLQPNFALNQPLSPFALAAIELLDPREAPGQGIGTGHYALDVVSVIESTLDDPRPILSQQQYKARGEAVGAMKQEGIEYDQRMELLEEVTWPKPLDELLAQSFETFASSQPWVRDFELSPKSVVRDMFERSMSFGEYVSFYQLARSEGLVLRYLSDAFRAVRQTVPTEAKDEELLDIIEWLGELVRQVDSSLVDEWNELVDPSSHLPEDEAAVVPPPPPSVVTNRRAFTVLVRNELFRRVQLAALERDDELAELDPDAGWPDALDRYYAEHDDILHGCGGALAAARHDRRVGCRGRHLARRADDRRPGGRPRLAHPRRGRPARVGGGGRRGRAGHRGRAALTLRCMVRARRILRPA